MLLSSLGIEDGKKVLSSLQRALGGLKFELPTIGREAFEQQRSPTESQVIPTRAALPRWITPCTFGS